MDCWDLLDNVLEEYVIIPAADPGSPVLVKELDMRYAEYFVEAIRLVNSNSSFNKEDFKQRRMYLCEAYCLLWQQALGGSLENLSKNEELQYGIHAAILIDLFALGKIQFRKHSNELFVEVIDNEPTFTFIDTILFDRLLKQTNRRRNKQVIEWLSLAARTDCVRATMRNLNLRGISSATNSIFAPVKSPTRKHSLMQYGPAKRLEQEIKATVLNKGRPNSFILSIFTLFSAGDDSCDCDGNTVLERYFSAKEFRVAKENIRVMVTSQGEVLRSAKYRLKKFSCDVSNSMHR